MPAPSASCARGGRWRLTTDPPRPSSRCASRASGLAFRSDLDTLALSGHPAWLDHVLGKALGGRIPQTGSATAMAGALCCRVDAEHAVVVAPAGASARWRRIAREAIVVGNPIAFADRSADLTVLSLVGPRARRLLAAAGLTGELGRDVRDGALAGVPVVVVREHGDALPARGRSNWKSPPLHVYSFKRLSKRIARFGSLPLQALAQFGATSPTARLAGEGRHVHEERHLERRLFHADARERRRTSASAMISPISTFLRSPEIATMSPSDRLGSVTYCSRFRPEHSTGKSSHHRGSRRTARSARRPRPQCRQATRRNARGVLRRGLGLGAGGWPVRALLAVRAAWPIWLSSG